MWQTNENPGTLPNALDMSKLLFWDSPGRLQHEHICAAEISARTDNYYASISILRNLPITLALYCEKSRLTMKHFTYGQMFMCL